MKRATIFKIIVALILIGPVRAQQLGTPITVPYFEPPRHMDLCGEPVPLHRQDVMERFDREFTIVVYAHAQVYLWLKRAERYFPWLERQLREKGLPEDLKYVAVAESDLLHEARSPAGAAGQWQFIEPTGKRYGLRVDSLVDERYDYQKSALRAMNYLKDLYEQFNSWALALAAYNCGEDLVARSIQEQGVSSYYDLVLPKETERYVFRILAIKEVLSHPEKYGYFLPPGKGYPPLEFDDVSVNLDTYVPVVEVARAAGVSLREFKRLNPSFRAKEIPPGYYVIRVPHGTGPQFKTALSELERRYKTKIVYHVVKRGETLSSIARRYGVSVYALKKWNNIKGDLITVGQKLKIKR
ncbi:lytic transglycosylase domain-containing protein [Thermodesulforhabdus norvegica]|uniref:LysM domain-containing protein n=1 Tax=Thermodesulforhabdus norvegica TaxID=39841 RepID=A0A1I4TF05_9BACT|nr:lytic transglycosylase domain-containing protein [Thermodesulforhabdus norvegica]SFM75193.1 LysM domain-containing protein [Thermodesulforhabdus norvegica]